MEDLPFFLVYQSTNIVGYTLYAAVAFFEQISDTVITQNIKFANLLLLIVLLVVWFPWILKTVVFSTCTLFEIRNEMFELEAGLSGCVAWFRSGWVVWFRLGGLVQEWLGGLFQEWLGGLIQEWLVGFVEEHF